MAKRFSRYDDDTKGKFTSVVRDGKGNPVTSGSGKAVMSRSFRAPATASTAPSKPKATQTTGTTKRASTGGPARYNSTASSTGGPARYQAPSMQTGPRSRPNNAPAATAKSSSSSTPKKNVAFPKLHAYLFDRRQFGPQFGESLDPLKTAPSKPKTSSKKPSRRDGRKPAGR